MWHPAALYLAVLFSTTLVDGQPCNSDAPDNCNFADWLLSCSWTFDSNDWTYEYEPSSAVFGTAGSSVANVTSRTACPTGEETHCLQIRYLSELNNIGMRVILFRVRDEDDRNDGGEQLGDDSRELAAWNGTDADIGVWHTASIPIQSRDNFTITVETRTFTRGNGKMFIRNFNYIKAPCSTLPISTARQERTTTVGSHVSSDASNDVGVVVGVVVAVIVIAVALIFFVLYRHRQLHLWRTCFRKSKRTDSALTRRPQNTEAAVANDDTAFSTGANAASLNGNESLYLTPISHEYRNTTSDPYYVNQHVDQTPTSQEDTGTPTGPNTPRYTNYVNQQLYTTPGARSPDNVYSDLRNRVGSDAVLPHNPYVNQTMRADNQNSLDTFRRTSDDPYEVV